MKVTVFLLLIYCSLQGTVIQPFSGEIGMGYRQDRFVLKVLSDTSQELLQFEEKITRARYLSSRVAVRSIERDLYFFSEFGYNYLLNKYMTIKDRSQELYTFTYKVDSYDLDTKGEVGYAVDLTPDRFNKMIIVPLVGYAGFWKIIDVHHPDPSPLIIWNTKEIYSKVKKQLKQVWYGPYIGGKVEFLPNTNWVFDLGYSFSWLNVFVKFTSSLKSYVSSDILEFQEKKINNTIHDGYSHFAMIKGSCEISKRVWAALLLTFNYFMCDKKNTNMKNEEKTIPSGQESEHKDKSKLYDKWWNIGAIFNLIFRF